MKFLSTLLSITLLAACGSPPSDEDRVRETILEIETAAEARDASEVLGHVTAGYQDAQGFDRSRLQNFLRGYFLSHPKIELLVNVESLQFPADGLAQAELTLTTVSLSDPDRAHLKVEFRRDGDAWRVSRADRLQP